MNFARSCSRCISTARSSRTTTSRVIALPISRGFSAFTPSNPGKSQSSLPLSLGEADHIQYWSLAFKKSSKQQAVEFEEEFQEDEFDDIDATLEQSESTQSSSLGGGGKEQRYSASLAQVERVNSQPLFRLASNQPSSSLITSLLTHSTTETLHKTLESIEQWRKKRLPLLSERAVNILIKRLSQQHDQVGGDGQDLVLKVLGDRSKYGVEISDIKQLYPLFQKFSKPHLFVESTNSGSPSSICNDLLTLSRQHTPSTTSTDSFAHLCVLSSILSGFKTPPTSPQIEFLINHLQNLGEDFILQDLNQKLSKKEKLVMRFRAMRVTEELRKRQVLEDSTEWFAHLTERLVILTK
ncbi:hypothetical protein JCM3765_001420 [Sporobolomyces pararoseus]